MMVSEGLTDSVHGTAEWVWSGDPVSGIGDEASSVFSQTGEGFPAVIVRKGAVGFEVAIHSAKVLALPDHGLAKEEALATLIVSRL